MFIDYNQLTRNYAQHRQVTPMVLANLAVRPVSTR